MPGTPSRKGKHPQNSKKAKAIQRQKQADGKSIARSASAREALPVTASASQAARPTPSDPANRQAIAQQRDTMVYPFLSGELKRIGILAAAIIIVLIILAIVI